MPALLNDPTVIEALQTRWRGIAAALVDALPQVGFTDRDIAITGTPAVIRLAHWGDIALIETRGGPMAVVRAQTPNAATITFELDRPDDEVVADITDAVGCLVRRRQRRVDDDLAAKEAELAEMVSLTGWTCTGVTGHAPAAGFRDRCDRIRGHLTRTEHRPHEPSSATFAISLEIAGMTYAESLRVLAAIRQDLVDEQGACQDHQPL